MSQLLAHRDVRSAEPYHLAALLALYRHLNPEMPELAPEAAAHIWREMLAQPGLTVFVAPVETILAATCTLITAPNLMRGGAPYGFLENVVTHGGYRRQGYGRAVIDAAVESARTMGCHQVMLLTGHLNTPAHAFYRSCGFTADLKAGFVIRRPD